MSKKSVKPKKCKQCGTEYFPTNSLHTVCSMPCALKMIEKRNYHKQQEKIKIERKLDREKREALKSRKAWLSDAQAMFNKFIRLRDAKLPCISCGTMEATWDAGHYRTTAAAPHLRFHEDNVHKQCVHCNQHKSGNIVQMRMGMVTKIGLQKVEALENDNTLKRFTIDEIKVIKEKYRDKIKQLQKENHA